MKNVKFSQKINFPECDGDRKPRLLAAQNSRSFICAPRFDQVTIKKLSKNMAIFVRNPNTHFSIQKTKVFGNHFAK